MLEFIAKYWVDFLLSAIGTAIVAYFARIKKLFERDEKEKLQNLFNEFYGKVEVCLNNRFASLEEEDKQIAERLDKINQEMEPLTDGVLSLHRRKFLDDCRPFLKEGIEITLEDFNRVQREHKVYKNLGGNHEGDENWELFKAKYEAQLKKGS